MREWIGERREAITGTLGDKPEAWESFDTANREDWDAMCDWLHEKLQQFRAVIEAEPGETLE